MSGEIDCRWCGALFTQASRKGPVPKWCSKACRQRAYEFRRTSARRDLLAEIAAAPVRGADEAAVEVAIPASIWNDLQAWNKTLPWNKAPS